jgi:uncharacterized protein YecT (DUF1311 family)
LLSVFMIAAAAAAGSQPNCKHPTTDFDMNICSGRDYSTADAAMTHEYRIVAAKMRQMDKEQSGYFSALLESQRAWLKFRDAQCRLEGYRTRGGTAERLNVNGCLWDLTKHRTEELKSLAEAF